MATTSIVDWLKGQGQDSSYAARKKKAAELGIQNYSGTAAQNTQMLKSLQSTPTVTPASKTSTTITTPPKITPVQTDKKISNLEYEYGGVGQGVDPEYKKAIQSGTEKEYLEGITSKLPSQKNKQTGSSTGGSAGASGSTPYSQAYKDAEAKGDIAGQIDAATKGDQWRISQGMQPINQNLIASLKAKLPNVSGIDIQDPNMSKIDIQDPNQASNELLNMINELNKKVQGFDFKPSEAQDDYTKRILDDINRQLEMLKREKEGALTQARGNILTEGGVARRELDDVYQQQIDELSRKADEIRGAYSSGKRGIESVREETTPTFQTERAQTDSATQRAVKNVVDYFKRRGLGTGGQAGAAVTETAQKGLTEQGDINVRESDFMRDISNRLAGIEEQQSSGLADIERIKGQAGQSLASGKRNVIERVNNALSGLDVDEKNLLSDLADMRVSMESGIESQYKDMTAKEKNEAFNMLLQQYGVGAQSVDTVRGLVNDIVNIRKGDLAMESQKLQNEIAKLELQQMPELQRLQVSELKKRIAQIGAVPAKTEKEKEYEQIKIDLAREELNQIQGKGGLTYKDYITMGREMMDKGYKAYDYDKEEEVFKKINDPQVVKEWALGLLLEPAEIAKLLSDLGVPK